MAEPTLFLPKFYEKLWKFATVSPSTRAMMQTEGAEECKCVFKGHVSCQNTVTRGQVFANRMRYFENYPDSKQYMVDFLKNKKVNKGLPQLHIDNPQKKPHIHYFMDNTEVCRNFFEVAMHIDHRIVNDIAAMVLGMEDRPRKEEKKLLSPVTPPTTTQRGIVKAFWESFFSLCQVPSEGVRLFPANESYELIYFCKFVPWWEATHGPGSGDRPPVTSDLPLAANPVVARVCYAVDDINRARNDMKHGDDVVLEPGDRKEEHSRGPEPVVTSDEWVDDIQVEDENQLKYVHNGRPFGMKVPDGCPSFSTFYRGRFAPEFRDVTKRPKHTQARCDTCSSYHTQLIDAWQKREDLTAIRLKVANHEYDVRTWRDFEINMQSKSTYSPAEVIVLSYDDTVVLGMPRLTNRDIKGLTTYRVNVIPFSLSNHGTREEFYYYTLQGQYKKGANRLCTTLCHHIDRIKHRVVKTVAEANQKKARRLVLLADNCSENKNNTLVAYLTELIYFGLFDKVELYFGPVGHTHNGRDVVHSKHNNDVGNFESVSLPEFFKAYYAVWTNPATRPQPIIVDVQYDWDRHYQDTIRTVSYLADCRAIKLERNPEGLIEMHLKESPQHSQWCGRGGMPGAPGWIVLSRVTHTMPDIIPPKRLKLETKQQSGLVALRGRKMMDYMASIGKVANMKWTLQMVDLGRIPPGKPVTEAQAIAKYPNLAGYEHLEEIGVPGHTTIVPFVRAKKCNTMEEFYGVDLNVEDPTPSVSQVTEPVTPLRARYTDEPGPRPKKAKAAMLTTDDSVADMDDDLQSPISASFSSWKSWPDFSLCHKGDYAVLKIEYDGGKGGIAVHKVHFL